MKKLIVTFMSLCLMVSAQAQNPPKPAPPAPPVVPKNNPNPVPAVPKNNPVPGAQNPGVPKAPRCAGGRASGSETQSSGTCCPSRAGD